MLPEEVIKHFTDMDDKEYGIIEMVSSNILPMDLCEKELKHINWKCVDKVNLYKIVDNKPILIKSVD